MIEVSLKIGPTPGLIGSMPFQHSVDLHVPSTSLFVYISWTPYSNSLCPILILLLALNGSRVDMIGTLAFDNRAGWCTHRWDSAFIKAAGWLAAAPNVLNAWWSQFFIGDSGIININYFFLELGLEETEFFLASSLLQQCLLNQKK